MEEKWLMIGRLLDLIGEKNLAKDAYNIHEKLEELYPNVDYTARKIQEAVKHTLQSLTVSLQERKGVTPSQHILILRTVRVLSRDSTICVACHQHLHKCDECRFGLKYGKCEDEDSLFSEFYGKLCNRIRQLDETGLLLKLERWKNRKIKRIIWEKCKGRRRVELILLDNDTLVLRKSKLREVYDQMWTSDLVDIVEVPKMIPKCTPFEKLWNWHGEVKC